MQKGAEYAGKIFTRQEKTEKVSPKLSLLPQIPLQNPQKIATSTSTLDLTSKTK
jgi:hypothetical protein